MRKSRELMQRCAAVLSGSLLLGSPAFTQAEPIFDWLYRHYSHAEPAITGVTPMLNVAYPLDNNLVWREAGWIDPLQTAHDNGDPVAILVRDYTSPLDGLAPGADPYEDRNTLETLLNWMDARDIDLDYVVVNFEFHGSTNPDHVQKLQENMLQNNANLRAVIQKVRSHPSANINNAKFIGVNWNGGTQLLTMAVPAHVDRTPVDTFYRTETYNGERVMNIAMPDGYPHAYFAQHWRDHIWNGWGLESTPTLRGAFFWAPLESISNGARNLYPGDTLMPVFSGFIPHPDYSIAGEDKPTVSEFRAIVQHARLRGAHTYATFREYLTDLNVVKFKGHWDDLNWFFARPGISTVLNTNTNKKTGLEWSGIRRGERTLVLASNLSGAAATVPLTPAVGQPVPDGLPAQSPQLPNNTHLLSQYLVTPSLDETFESYTPNVTMNNFGYGSNSSEWEVRPGPTGSINTSLALTRTANGAAPGYKTTWFKKATAAFDAADKVVYSVKIFSGERVVGSVAPSGFGLCRIDPGLENNPGNVPNADRQGVFIEFTGNNSMRVLRNMSSGPVEYFANEINLIAPNTWYEVRLEVTRQANGGLGTVYLRNLIQGGAPVAVHFDDVEQAGVQDVTEIPLFFADPAIKPTQFNGWELWGHNSTVYFDDFKAELNPTIQQFSGSTP